MTTAIKKSRLAKKTAKPTKAELRVRLDPKTKAKAERLFKRYGMTTGDGVRLLIDKALKDKALPLDMDEDRELSPESLKALAEAESGQFTKITIEELRKFWDEA